MELFHDLSPRKYGTGPGSNSRPLDLYSLPIALRGPVEKKTVKKAWLNTDKQRVRQDVLPIRISCMETKYNILFIIYFLVSPRKMRQKNTRKGKYMITFQMGLNLFDKSDSNISSNTPASCSPLKKWMSAILEIFFIESTSEF